MCDGSCTKLHKHMKIRWGENVLVSWLIFVVYNYSIFQLKQVTLMNLFSLFSHDIVIKCVLPVLTRQIPPQIMDNVTSNAEEERNAFMRELADVKDCLSVWIVHFTSVAKTHCQNHKKMSRSICAHRLWAPPWAWALDHHSLLSVKPCQFFQELKPIVCACPLPTTPPNLIHSNLVLCCLSAPSTQHCKIYSNFCKFLLWSIICKTKERTQGETTIDQKMEEEHYLKEMLLKNYRSVCCVICCHISKNTNTIDFLCKSLQQSIAIEIMDDHHGKNKDFQIQKQMINRIKLNSENSYT